MTNDRRHCEERDWAGDWLTLAAVWGLPTVAMLLALVLDPEWRASVGRHVGMDGYGLRVKRPPLWPHALSLHWAILSWHGRSGGRLYCRLRAARPSALAGARHYDRWRQRVDLVGQRTFLRDIFRRPTS